MYHAVMMYRASPISHCLPEQIIPKGAHVLLDIRSGNLRIVSATEEMSVVIAEYAIHNQNIALDFFAYLTQYKDRFASVQIR